MLAVNECEMLMLCETDNAYDRTAKVTRVMARQTMDTEQPT